MKKPIEPTPEDWENVRRSLENPLALRLLEGEFREGDTVRVDARNGELAFERATVAEPAAA